MSNFMFKGALLILFLQYMFEAEAQRAENTDVPASAMTSCTGNALALALLGR